MKVTRLYSILCLLSLVCISPDVHHFWNSLDPHLWPTPRVPIPSGIRHSIQNGREDLSCKGIHNPGVVTTKPHS